MKTIIVIMLLLSLSAVAEESSSTAMSGKRLQDILLQLGSDVTVSGNMIEFQYNSVKLLCIYDENANRMRLISAIDQVDNIPTEQLLIALAANFHTALDARYAVSKGVVYSAFLHPLQSLTEQDLQSAVHQVSNANLSFGTNYSSGALHFPDGSSGSSNESKGKRAHSAI